MRDGGPLSADSFADPPLRCAEAGDFGGCPLVRLSGGGCGCLEPEEPLLGAYGPRECPLDSMRLYSMFRGLRWVVERWLVVDGVAVVG